MITKSELKAHIEKMEDLLYTPDAVPVGLIEQELHDFGKLILKSIDEFEEEREENRQRGIENDLEF